MLMAFKLLTEPEVAEMLRCSVYTVARLRKSGKLAYIPGDLSSLMRLT
jgi:hypothetical protein